MTDSLSTIHHLVDDLADKPSSRTDEVFRNADGDLWQLIRERSTGKSLVRHTSNVSSGGAISEMSVEEFLAINGSGPEHAALRLLMKKLSAG